MQAPLPVRMNHLRPIAPNGHGRGHRRHAHGRSRSANLPRPSLPAKAGRPTARWGGGSRGSNGDGGHGGTPPKDALEGRWAQGADLGSSRIATMGRKLATALAWYRCIHSTFTCGCIIGCMALRALLMRLFLVVALLANGPGVAGASMHLEHLRNSGDLSDVAAVQAAAEAITACHGAEATAPAAVDHGPPQATNEAGDASPADDCCRAGDCCACMHHCSAALAWSMLADLSTGYRQTAEPFLSGHASAARANLLRPPIG